MEKHRYYFRLSKSIGKLCEENHKELPSEKILAKIARSRGFAFNEKNVQPALYENAAFADGLLHALANWFGIRESTFVELTMDCPRFKEARFGDFLMIGMRPLVERLTGHLRLREDAFFKTERDVERAAVINLSSSGACLWDSTQHEPTLEDLVHRGLKNLGVTRLEDYTSSLQTFWRFNPHSIIYSVTSSKSKVGVSGVVPLKKKSYDAVRSGKRSVFELDANDLDWPSNHQLIHFGAIRMDDRNQTPKIEQTRCLAMSIFIQIALMASKPLEDLQVVSYGGTPENHKRLEQSGFAKLDVNEPRLNVPLFEINKKLPAFGWAKKLLYDIQVSNR